MFFISQYCQPVVGKLPEQCYLVSEPVPGEMFPGIDADLKIGLPFPWQAEALDNAELDKEAGHGAYRTTAGYQGVHQLAWGLVGRIAYHETAKYTAGHTGKPRLLEDDTDFFHELSFFVR
jgi:hypothetical protein